MPASTRTKKSSNPKPNNPGSHNPVLKVTRYDLVSSTMMAIVIGLIVAVVWLFIWWNSTRIADPRTDVDLELIEIPGGFADGAPDETLLLESPEEETTDPSLSEPSDEIKIEEAFENVVELSAEASTQVDKQYEIDDSTSGKPGSASGTGRRPLGEGKGLSGLPREQRWIVTYNDRSGLSSYAKQLDHFGIELGALMPGGTLIYISKLSSASPKKRTEKSGLNEKRLYMTWQGGGRRKGDIQLFRKAGVNATGVTIFHFYPRETEQRMANLEIKYRNRKTKDIRRTYFTVSSSSGGYAFNVTNQTYFH